MTPTTCNRAEVQNCNETPCPVDCRITGWTDWSGCSETCGDGVEYKDPIIGDQAQHGGEACPAAQERVCNLCASPPPTTTTTPATTPVPVDCVIDDFVARRGSEAGERGQRARGGSTHRGLKCVSSALSRSSFETKHAIGNSLYQQAYQSSRFLLKSPIQHPY